jgi:hypothetical protein
MNHKFTGADNALHGYSNFPNNTKVMGILPCKKGRGILFTKYLF